MKKHKIIFVFVLFFTSCVGFPENKQPGSKELKTLFEQNTFDSSVIKNLQCYNDIKDIVIENLDTIIKFSNSKDYYSNKYSGASTTEKNNSFSYWKDYDEDTITNMGDNSKELASNANYLKMPKFIFAKVDKLFTVIGKNNISGFWVGEDSSFKIYVRKYYDEKINAEAEHTLFWKRGNIAQYHPSSFERDTVLPKGWLYQISVDAHIGF